MVPKEILEIILSFVTDLKCICNCRLVSYDFMQMVEKKITKMNGKGKIDMGFLKLFPNLRYLNTPLYVTNWEKLSLSHLSTITLKLDVVNLLDISSFLEELIMENKCVKIYKNNSIYWLKLGTYGKYVKYGEDFNEIDGQLMDICRCKTLISNQKPYHYFPVQNYIYLSSIENISSFDFYPPSSVISYSWQPILSEDRRKINYLKELSNSVNEINEINSKIRKYEMPILSKHIPHIKKVFPNIENLSILKGMEIHFKNKILKLDELKEGEEIVDSFFQK